MNELARLTLRLRPTHADTIPAWTARAAHAWFLDSLRQIDPALSAAIHDGPGLKPLSVSGLLPAPSGELRRLHPRQPLTLHLATLHPDVTRITLNTLVPYWRRHHIILHDQPLRVEAIETSATTYGDLLAYHLDRSSRRSLSLRFITPTMFKKTGNRQIPLPLPEYVFGSLIDRWTAFSPVSLPDDLREFAINHAMISRHNIQTRDITFARGRRGTATGFTGDVTFHFTSGQSPHLAFCHTLGAFAAFSGVGAKTSNGLGQVAGPAALSGLRREA